MPDLAAAFQSPTNRVVDLGELVVPSGALYCCDPFLSHEVGPLERWVPPGRYRVQVCVAPTGEWGPRVAMARLVLSERRAVAWQEASFRHHGVRSSRFRVDAGLACFMDASTRDLLVEAVDACHDAGPDANYYNDMLAAEFRRNADPTRPYHAGDWALHAPLAGDERNVALFASGLGDGYYRAWWGLDDAGIAVALVVDFELLP